MSCFCSGVLFTINYVVIHQFKLNFVDLALVRFMIQTLAILFRIKCAFKSKTTQTFGTSPLTEDETIIDETKLWVQHVDQDKNLCLIRFIHTGCLHLCLKYATWGFLCDHIFNISSDNVTGQNTLEAETETAQGGVWHSTASWPGTGGSTTCIVWSPS